jgi:GNAT superfamily N-acetyltransferase
MSGANYAHCGAEPCLKPTGSTKVFYVGDDDLPAGTVIRHGACDAALLADVEMLKARIAELEAHPAMLVDPGAEARGYGRAIAHLRDTDAYARWCRVRTYAPLSEADRTEFADYLDAVKETP